MTTTQLEIVDLGKQLIAHWQRVIHATAQPDINGSWSVTLRGGDAYNLGSKAAAWLFLDTLTPTLQPATGILCQDTACCLGCEHTGDGHKAGRCWRGAAEGSQCRCDVFEPAGIEHRHISPAPEMAR